MAKFMVARHSKSAPAPDALPAGEKIHYCHTCGRAISPNKSNQKNPQTPVKYCSERCRQHKPKKDGIEQKIESVFVELLSQEVTSTGEKAKLKKGDRGRRVVLCSEAEEVVFDRVGLRGEKMTGRERKMREKRAKLAGEDESNNGEMATDEGSVGGDTDINGEPDVDGDEEHEAGNRPDSRAVTPHIGAPHSLEPSAEETARREGLQRAKERELVKQAARRGVAFGFLVAQVSEHDKTGDNKNDVAQTRRKAEPVLNGKIVDVSTVKGEWGIRWVEGE